MHEWYTNTSKNIQRLIDQAAENLSVEAEKNDVTFLCGIEWHC